MEDISSNTDAPEQLRRSDVLGRGRDIAGNDEVVPNERLTEEAGDDDDQVKHAADSCINLRRAFSFVNYHADSSLLRYGQRAQT